jgi:hypothetical protein
MTDLTAPTLAVYLGVAIPLTLFVTRSLFRHGRVFLVDVFHGNEEVADAVNSLLVVGFLLFNLGYVFLFVKSTSIVETPLAAMNLGASKIGTVSLFLGGLHLINIVVFAKIRKGAIAGVTSHFPAVDRTPGYLPPAPIAPVGPVAR